MLSIWIILDEETISCAGIQT